MNIYKSKKDNYLIEHKEFMKKRMKEIKDWKGIIFSFLLFFGVIGFMHFSSALDLPLDNLGTFKSGEQVRVVQICDDASWITISSISYPNSTIAMPAVNMSSAGAGEFYLFYNNTLPIGRYDVRGISDGCEGVFATYFNITSTGIVANGALIFLIFLSLLGIVFFIASLITPEEFFVYISGLCFLIGGIYLLIYGLDVLNDTYTRMIGYIYIGIGILFTVGAYIFNWINNQKEEEEEEY